MDYSKLTPQELVRECARNPCAEVWEAFMAEFDPVIIRTVCNVTRLFREPRREIREELVQEVYMKICGNEREVLKQMDTSPESKPHSFFKKVTTNVVFDHFKGRTAKKRGGGAAPENIDDVQPPSSPSSEGGVCDVEWRILLRELDAKLAELGYSERERETFWFYWLQDWTAKQIAAESWACLSEKGVESLLRRMRLDLCGFFDQDKGTAA